MRQNAEVLPKSPRIGPLHEERPYPKSAEGYGRKGCGPRASALARFFPAAGHRLLLFGGCGLGYSALGLRESAGVRLLPCWLSGIPGTSAVLKCNASYGVDRLPVLLPMRP